MQKWIQKVEKVAADGHYSSGKVQKYNNSDVPASRDKTLLLDSYVHSYDS